MPPLDDNDRDTLDDLLGRHPLPELLDAIARAYDRPINDEPSSEDAQVARGIANDVMDSVMPVIVNARREIAKRVRDGLDLARRFGL